MVLLLAAFASFIQSTVGFGLGLIFMAGAGIFGLMGLPEAAAKVSVFGILSSSIALYGNEELVDRRIFTRLIAGSIPGMALGYFLLFMFGTSAAETCKLVLGILVIFSAVVLAVKPMVRSKPSGTARLLGFGLLSGIMGGFTSTAGPPLVFVLNSEPIGFAKARANILAVFLVLSTIRLVLYIFTDTPSLNWFLSTVLTLVAVAVGAVAARLVSLPFSDTGLKRLSYGILVILGITLVI